MTNPLIAPIIITTYFELFFLNSCIFIEFSTFFVQYKRVIHRIFEDFVGKTCAFQNYESSVSYGVIHDIKLGAKSFDSNISIFILESIELGILLALSGGFMDAYSYIGRGGVFANAQTGNMLLLGVHLSEGDIPDAIRYLCPVLAFTFGIALSDIVRNLGKGGHLHWRQISVVTEAIILAIVSFFPQSHNLLANSLTSLACGIQVETFRKIHGNGIATTMCIGNLRSGTQNIYTFFQTKKRDSLEKGLLYYGIILCFICGAIIGNQCIKYLHERAILVSSALLLLSFIMMFITRDEA